MQKAPKYLVLAQCFRFWYLHLLYTIVCASSKSPGDTQFELKYGQPILAFSNTIMVSSEKEVGSSALIKSRQVNGLHSAI